MHEYGVASEIAAIVRQTAGTSRVKKITLGIGNISGIFPESLLMYLREILLPEQGMDGVEVETKEVPATFVCACKTEYMAEDIFSACPACGGFDRTIKAGHDCTIESIEVEDV
jgi:hydrogenase nickel incorporation protein HypA/HybF